ncbi:hypothetical protein SAMN04489806_3155 [Paramicrobacterium humi]|uniref:EcsC protein family protein n=1 Tax=Paramicrobacterium humi TaxID=640635 RepID=A0A1H4TB78_9MICO|nr:hypothetical protein [Microbacterium humi]SEC53597.1 hypothetical protein SAMN04489806_3155 [Microbacterium humi]
MTEEQPTSTPVIVDPAAVERAGAAEDLPLWLRSIERVLAVQRPVVMAHIRGIRRSHPHATPEQLVRVLERRYLAAITTGGAAVGATAAVPAIGTGVALALAATETVGFLESTALFAQSVAELHGLPVSDPVRARALVMTMLLGRPGMELIRQFTGKTLHSVPARGTFWGEMITSTLPQFAVGPFADELKKRFIKKLLASQGTSLVGKVIPFGIGAAIGGVGNHIAGREVVKSARSAFGPAPLRLAPELEPRDRSARSGAAQLRARIPVVRRGGRERDHDED